MSQNNIVLALKTYEIIILFEKVKIHAIILHVLSIPLDTVITNYYYK